MDEVIKVLHLIHHMQRVNDIRLFNVEQNEKIISERLVQSQVYSSSEMSSPDKR